MPIRELFHFMHLVDDFDPVHDRYEQLLAPQDWGPKSWSDFDKRWATLANVGPDFVLEIMEPSKEPDDGGSPLPKFFARHGSHLHSFAWYVDGDDVAPLAQRMRDLGVRVLTPYSAFNPDGPLTTFFTHPKDSHGQLEFQARPSGEGDRDRQLDPVWDGKTPWRDHPLGLERMSHLTLVVGDLEQARTFYAQALDAPAFFEEETSDRLSAYTFVGTRTCVELAQPTSAESWIGKDLAAHGDIPHAMTFKVKDLAAAARHVDDCGIGIAWRNDEMIVLDPADMDNSVVGFTTRVLPSDPRE